MKAFSLILRILVGLLFLLAGAGKFMHESPSIELFGMLGMEPVGRWLVGALELTAAILILLPRATAAGALLGWGVMTGALIAHLSILGFDGRNGIMALAALLAWLGCAALIYLHRREVDFIRCMFAFDQPDESTDPEDDHQP